MENNLNDFKTALKEGMIKNFENDGYLTPFVFFYKDGIPMMSVIPPEMLSSGYGKEILGQMIKSFCTQPNVLAAGLIIEASGAKLETDSEMAKLLTNGDVRVSELKNKVDIIIMIFSTPESEEMIAYEVNCEKHEVGEKFGYDEAKAIGGTFSNFFTWNRN